MNETIHRPNSDRMGVKDKHLNDIIFKAIEWQWKNKKVNIVLSHTKASLSLELLEYVNPVPLRCENLHPRKIEGLWVWH